MGQHLHLCQEPGRTDYCRRAWARLRHCPAGDCRERAGISYPRLDRRRTHRRATYPDGAWGLKDWPVRQDMPLEVVPVDLVAAAILVAGALLLDGRHEPVYQLATADVNPILLGPLVSLLDAESHRRRTKAQSGARNGAGNGTGAESRNGNGRAAIGVP